MGNSNAAACVGYLTMLSVAQASEAFNDKAVNTKTCLKGCGGSGRGMRTAVSLQLCAKTEKYHEVPQSGYSA